MSGARVFFMIFYGLLGLLGLIMAGIAQDIGISIFGWGLVAFGVLNAFRTIAAHFDEAAKAH
jgi:hypothetical protein